MGDLGDKRNDAHEDVYQGTIKWRRALGLIALMVGYQRSQRTPSFEDHTVIDSNVWIDSAYRF